MNKIPFSIRMILLGALVSIATAQESPSNAWSLPALQQLLLNQSPALTAARARIDGGQAGVSIARSSYLPRVDASVSYDDYVKIAKVLQFDEPQPYTLASYRLTARQTLYDGGETRRRVAIAGGELRETQLLLYQIEQQLQQELIEHYFDVTIAELEADYLARIETVATERQTITEEQFARGTIDRLVLLQATTSRQQINERKLMSALARDLAQSEMSRLINVDQSFWQRRPEFAAPLALNAPAPVNTTTLSIDEQIAENAVEIAREKYAESGAPRVPKVEAYANIGHRALESFAYEDAGLEKSAGIAVTWGLTDVFTNRHERRRAKSAVTSAEAEQQIARRSHQANVQSILRRRAHNQRLLAMQSELQTLQAERLDAARRTAASGVISRATLLVEVEQTLTAELELERARLNVSRQDYLLDLVLTHPSTSQE